MARFAIAHYSESQGVQLKLVEMDSQESALRFFFNHYVEEYTPNDEGYAYFRDDFYDVDKPMGQMTEI